MPPKPDRRDPWRRAPVGELAEQLLPRWFVLLAVAAVPLAAAVLIAAFALTDRGPGPVAQRRPPAAGGQSTAVGEFVVGDSPPRAWQAACAPLEGVRIAGTAVDLAAISRGLQALCDSDRPAGTDRALRTFAAAGGVVRFGAFARTGVDSTVLLPGTASGDPRSPVLLLNNKLTLTDPAWIAPLVAHDAVLIAGDPADARQALRARQAEAAVCAALFGGDRRPSRGCRDAAELLALPDPLRALRAAGFR